MPLTTLRSARLEASIDPQHGAELLTLREGGSDGASLLARTPGAAAARPHAGELDEATWTAAYRGGWQLLTPNAGDSCEVGGVRHGFHGRASNDPWQIVATSGTTARLLWRGHGLTVTRTYQLAGAAIAVTTRWEATARPAPMLHVEHLALGGALLDPDVEVRLPQLRDGDPARVERLRSDEPRASFAVVGALAVGTVEIVNRARGLRVRLTWDADALPYLWLWHENRASGGVWRNRSEILGIEPAATADERGLGRAIDAGEATWVEPGRPVERCVVLRVERDDATRPDDRGPVPPGRGFLAEPGGGTGSGAA